jgi:uncharacterized membrane protein
MAGVVQGTKVRQARQAFAWDCHRCDEEYRPIGPLPEDARCATLIRMGSALILWIHIVAATLFVGPQAFLFMAAVPAMRTIDDVEARVKATSVVTTRFGWIGGGALIVLIVTGIFNFMHASDTGLTSLDRYFFILQLKIALVAVVVVLTLLHGGLLGRRLLKLRLSGASEEEMAATRRWSVILSAAVFVISIGILLCAALLGSDWSRQ